MDSGNRNRDNNLSILASLGSGSNRRTGTNSNVPASADISLNEPSLEEIHAQEVRAAYYDLGQAMSRSRDLYSREKEILASFTQEQISVFATDSELASSIIGSLSSKLEAQYSSIYNTYSHYVSECNRRSRI